MKIAFRVVGLVLGLFISASGAMAARDAPLVEKSYAFEGPSARTLGQVRNFILAGAGRYKQELTFQIEADNPGALQLEFNKGNEHFVSVLFAYTADGFDTKYIASKNLNYKEANGVRTIHPNYMVWIDDMIKQIALASAMQLDDKGEPTDASAVAFLTFRSVGDAPPVAFSMWDDSKPCGDLDRIGVVENVSQAVIAARQKEILEWNEKYKDTKLFGKSYLRTFVMPKEFLSLVANPSHPIHVHGYTSTHSGNTTLSCNPPLVRFTPEAGKKYSIDYVHSNFGSKYGACGLVVMDDTNPEQRVPVPSEKIPECKKKSWFN